MANRSPVPLSAELPDSFAVGVLERAVLHDTQPERLRYHTIYLLEKASESVQIDDPDHRLSEGQLLLAAKGQVLAFSAETRMEGFVISFGDCFWEKAPASASNCKAVLFNNAEANQQLIIPDSDLAELQPLFRSLLQESRKPAYSNQLDALAAYLKIIMIKIANINASLTEGFDNEEKQVYRHYIELVSQRYRSSHDVGTYAEELSVTSRKLTQICQRCTGKGAKDVITGQLVAEAKRLLLFSAMPVKEIAYGLHFSTPEQFSHFFKKHAGSSPNDYRGGYVNSDR